MIKKLLKGEVTSKRIVDLINDRDIDFGKIENLSVFLKELRDSGAEESLIDTVRKKWEIRRRILVIQTNFPDAIVYVDGVKKGRTDENGLRIEKLRPREYTIRVEKKGYKPIIYKISLIKKSKRLKVEFKPVKVEYGLFVVNSSPWSSVYIDGNKVGYTPKKIKLQVGTHQLELKKEGYQNYKQEITIKQKNTTRLFIQL